MHHRISGIIFLFFFLSRTRSEIFLLIQQICCSSLISWNNIKLEPPQTTKKCFDASAQVKGAKDKSQYDYWRSPETAGLASNSFNKIEPTIFIVVIVVVPWLCPLLSKESIFIQQANFCLVTPFSRSKEILQC